MRDKVKEISAQQDALRDKRNALQNEMMKIQNKIDTLEMDKYDVNKYLGKWIEIKCSEMRKYVHKVYMHVDKIDRLMHGPKLTGILVEVSMYYNLVPISTQITKNINWSTTEWENVDEEFSILENNKEIVDLVLNASKKILG